MSRLLATCLLLLCAPVFAESESEKIIGDAIRMMEAKRDDIKDALDKAKVDKAIRELEALIGDPDKPAPPVQFDVKPAVLKKKFGGRAVYNSKSGELTLTYDFGNKNQLSDFAVDDAKVAIVNNTLLIEGGDKLVHKAKFKSFTINSAISFKSLRGVGFSCTGGSQLRTGGMIPDTVYFEVAGAPPSQKIVAEELRSGTLVCSLAVSPKKTSMRFGPESFSIPTVKPDDFNQIILVAGSEGGGFSKVTIVGVPDPTWFKEFLAE